MHKGMHPPVSYKLARHAITRLNNNNHNELGTKRTRSNPSATRSQRTATTTTTDRYLTWLLLLPWLVVMVGTGHHITYHSGIVHLCGCLPADTGAGGGLVWWPPFCHGLGAHSHWPMSLHRWKTIGANHILLLVKQSTQRGQYTVIYRQYGY